MKAIPRTLKFMLHYWKPALAGLISLLLVNAANLYAPQLLRILIDDGITAKNMNSIWLVAVLLVLVALGRGIFTFLQGYLSEVTSQGVAFELRNVIFEKLQKLSFTYHDQAQTGKLMTRMTSDVDMVRMFTGNGLLQIVSALFLLVGTLIILFSMNVILTLIFLLMVPPIFVLFMTFVRKMMPLSMQVQQKLGLMNTVLQENLAGIRVVKAFAREDYEQGRFRERNHDFLGENINLVKLFTTFFPMVFFIANLGVVGVTWIGGLQVIGGSLTLGELVAFSSYQGFFLMPIFMLGFIGSSLSRAEASAQRLYEVIDAPMDVHDQPDAIDLPLLQGRVGFENVTFRYAGGEADVIHDVSFQAEPNQTIAILGRTGSGKSSIINLIPRFYDVTSGRITVDGYDVRSVKVSSLRSQIGIVLQETTLFSGTIRENIAYGRPDASMDEIIAVAKAAQAHEFILQFEQQYDTPIGERGVGLSGGQKQRIAIARALLMNPRILIMDDSTSSVDAETEYEIQKALELLRQGRTTFIIAQKISSIRNADMILLIDQGELIGMGKHEDLMKCCETYVEILETQFGDYAEWVEAVEKEVQ